MTTDRVMHDLKLLIRDAEDLVEATASDVSDRAKEARAQLRRALANAKETCERLPAGVKASARAADTAIREHPYQAIGLALGTGILLGVLAAARRG